MRNRQVKIFLIIICYVCIATAYPYIRFRNNWNNSDFVHQVTNLAFGIEFNTIFHTELSSHSLFWESIALITHHITGLDTVEIYLYAFPFSIGIISIVILTHFAKIKLRDNRWLVVSAVLVIIPTLAARRMAGKHSVFSLSLFFLVLAIATTRSSRRRRLLMTVFFLALMFYHVYISLILVTFMFVYLALKYLSRLWSVGSSSTQNRQRLFIWSLFAVLAWNSAFVIASVRAKSIFQRLVPYLFSARSGGEVTGSVGVSGSKAASGFQQYFDVLTGRWDPWWIWFVLNLPLLLLLLTAGSMWIRSTWAAISTRRNTSDIYLLSTVGGIFGLFTVGLSIRGFSATNLPFRYLPYVVPIFAVFLLSTDFFEQVNKYRIGTIILAAIFILGAVSTPVAVSNEPELQNVQFGSYTEYEHRAIVFGYQHATGPVGITNSLTEANAIMFIEMRTIISYRQFPLKEVNQIKYCPSITRYSTDIRNHQVYSNGKMTAGCLNT